MGNVCATNTCGDVVEDVPQKEAAAQLPTEEVKEAKEIKKAGPKTFIKIFGCRGLRNADWTWAPGLDGGLSDAYVICKEKTKDNVKESKDLCQTKTIQDSLEPIFDEEFEVSFAPDSILEFVVYDKDACKSDLLGRAEISCADLGNGFNGELELKDAGKDIKAYIKVLVKAPGGEYPSGPPSEFTITLKKGAKKELGFEVDDTATDCLFVTSIGNTGPVKEYNDDKERAVSEQMKTGQYIVKVNDVSGDEKKMVQELKKADTLVLSMVRPQYFTIAIKKKGPLGITVVQGAAAFIKSVSETGPIAEWNKANKDKEVKAGDRIVAVNGDMAKEKEQMKLLTTDGALQMVISRRSEASKGFWDWF